MDATQFNNKFFFCNYHPPPPPPPIVGGIDDCAQQSSHPFQPVDHSQNDFPGLNGPTCVHKSRCCDMNIRDDFRWQPPCSSIYHLFIWNVFSCIRGTFRSRIMAEQVHKPGIVSNTFRSDEHLCVELMQVGTFICCIELKARERPSVTFMAIAQGSSSAQLTTTLFLFNGSWPCRNLCHVWETFLWSALRWQRMVDISPSVKPYHMLDVIVE